MRTVNISAAAYDEALKFCNERMVEFGISPPITELPPGKAYAADSCPCSNTCKGKIRVWCQTWYTVKDLIHKDGSPSKFVNEFDTAVGLIDGSRNHQPGTEEFLPVRV